MTENDLLDDIDYIKSIAKDGQQAALVGGRIGLMWGPTHDGHIFCSVGNPIKDV